MALPKVTEPIAGQWPVSVAWRGWLETLDRRVASISTTTPETPAQYVPELRAGDGLTLWNNLAPGNVAIMQLALLADSGVGAGLVKITRDQYGRVEGTERPVPSDFPNPFATYLVDENGDYLTDADGNFLVSDDGTQVQDSITNGVTDKAPSQNAVFDALALKGGLGATQTWTGGNTYTQATIYSGQLRRDGPAGTDRDIQFLSSGSVRWLFSVSGAPESGGNAGSDFVLSRYTDAGVLIAPAFRITRAGGHFVPGVGAAQEIGSSSANWLRVYAQAHCVNSLQVVGARNTGWSAMTGTGSKATIAAAAAGTASAAYVQAELQAALNRIAALEARLKALDDALFTHGLIGT